MADEVVIKGGDQTLEISENENPKASELIQKIEELEQEKGELVRKNKAVRERISKLDGKVEMLEREKVELVNENESLDAEKMSLEATIARNDELHFEVWRLENDLIKAEADGAEADKEMVKFKREVEKLKVEKALLLKKLGDVENELRGVEKKFEDFEIRESDLILENYLGDYENKQLSKSIVDLELYIVRNVQEMEKVKKERDEVEGVKRLLEGVLEKSKVRVSEMEEKLGLMGKELEVADWMISGLKETVLDRIYDREKGIFGLKLRWPVITASTGVVAIVGALWGLRGKRV